MIEKQSEKGPKMAEKLLKNRANAHGMGVVRFSIAQIIFSATTPVTVTDIRLMLEEKHPTIQQRFIRTVIEELRQTGVCGLPLQCIEKRAGRTKAPAYFIHIQTNRHVR